MPQTILVTGATGTVGTELVKELSNLDIHVRAGVRSLIRGDKFNQYPDVQAVEMELSRPETFHAAFTGIDKLFMLTPFSPDQAAMGKFLVDEAKRLGVKHIVKLSALGAEAEPGIQLGRWHREVERYLEQSGIPFTILRPNSFMQNFAVFYGDSIRQMNKFFMPLGEGKVSYIDARDVALVAAKVLTEPGHENKIYNLTGPESLSGKDVAQAISEVKGQQVEYVDVPEQDVRAAMQKQQMPAWMIDAMLELFQMNKSNYTAEVTRDMEQVTGCRPRTFHEYARDCHNRFAS